MDILLLSPVNPFDPRCGHRMAVASDVHAILDSGLSLGVVGFLYPGQAGPRNPPCAAKLFPVRRGPFAVRYARSLLSGLPPSSERLYSRAARAGVREALRAWQPRYVLVDDVSMAGYIPDAREFAPAAKVILRTHNVMQDVRRAHLEHTRGLLRVPVGQDCRRYIAFEREAVRASDALWAISQADAARLAELYGRPCACLPVSIPQEKYLPLPVEEGANDCFVHVGTLDFRRKSDLQGFLHGSWPKIRAAAPEARLQLAGDLHGSPVEAPGASYMGRVEDDAAVYRTGRFALNFQNTTGGVKLKTLTSLAAGRTLVSTPLGVEGLDLKPGEHYWEMEQFVSPGRLSALLGDDAQSRRMAEAGRAWVRKHHSRPAVARIFSALMEAV